MSLSSCLQWARFRLRFCHILQTHLAILESKQVVTDSIYSLYISKVSIGSRPEGGIYFISPI